MEKDTNGAVSPEHNKYINAQIKVQCAQEVLKDLQVEYGPDSVAVARARIAIPDATQEVYAAARQLGIEI